MTPAATMKMVTPVVTEQSTAVGAVMWRWRGIGGAGSECSTSRSTPARRGEKASSDGFHGMSEER